MSDKEKLIERWLKLAGLKLLNEDAEDTQASAQEEINRSDNEPELVSPGHPGAVFQDEVDTFAAEEEVTIDENL